VANGDRTFLVAKAVSATEVGDAYGALTVHDDDPAA